MEKPEMIAIAIIAVIICGAIIYIVKAKKSGRKCIGCPDGGKCQGSCNGCSGCSCSVSEEDSTQE